MEDEIKTMDMDIDDSDRDYMTELDSCITTNMISKEVLSNYFAMFYV